MLDAKEVMQCCVQNQAVPVGKNQVLNLNRHAVLLDPFQAPVHYQKRLYQVNPEGQSSPAAGCATKISVSGANLHRGLWAQSLHVLA